MTGAERIAAERRWQLEEGGFTAEHDDAHGSLACRAVLYVVAGGIGNLVKAGALIAAEIDRLARAQAERQ